MGVLFLEQGRLGEAIECFNELLQIKPDHADARFHLAKAIELAEQSGELADCEQADFLDTLSVAYAMVGRFGEAIETAQKAISLAREAGQEALAEEIQDRLRLYKVGQLYNKESEKPVDIVQ